MNFAFILILLAIICFFIFREANRFAQILRWLRRKYTNWLYERIWQRFDDDKKNFAGSVIALAKARDLSQPPDDNTSSFKIPKETETRILRLTKEGISRSNRVGDGFLDYMHPKLLTMYREKLIQGAKLFVDGLEFKNQPKGLAKKLAGNKLTTEWIHWWELNKPDIGSTLGI